jgi:hypothetical protein
MKVRTLVAAVMMVLSSSLIEDAMAAGPFTATLDVDVGTGNTSVYMGGPGGMSGSMTTGGGPVELEDGQPFATMMYSMMTSRMSSMMGGQMLQQRMISFEIPGSGTVFAMLEGGNPWTGAKGILLGGTDGVQGISGTFVVGDQIGSGSNKYPFTFTYSMP